MSSEIAPTILANEEKRCAALRAGDADALAPLLSERLSFGHLTATYDDKPTLLDKLRSGTIIYKSLAVSDTRVVEQGDTALLFSRLTADVEVAGRPRAIDNRSLSVWAREGDDWRLLAYQQTPIPQ
ncbi:nuclear transport factor 2 family protein [Haliea sp. E17]|uniref:nuclear transport factor 2 family protein n=1 Tax=Haliea sp. E17 TaxID=3401576 RepID=UPI003AAE99A2